VSGLACTDDFRIVTYAQEIISGAGSVTRLEEAAEGFGWRRLMLCTSPSVRRAGHIEAVKCALGEALVAIYDETASHVQDYQLGEALKIAAAHQTDAVIGLGGGSAIGLAKAISRALEEQITGHPARAAAPSDQPLIPVIAIPTTYAGSEMTPIYGVTQHENGASRKVTVRDPKVTPKLVIYDPKLTLDLPPIVTASTGINALAHCVEALYSTSRNPLASAAAQSAAGHIAHALPRCTADGSDLEARTEMLIGSHLAGFACRSRRWGCITGCAMCWAAVQCHTASPTASCCRMRCDLTSMPQRLNWQCWRERWNCVQTMSATRQPLNWLLRASPNSSGGLACPSACARWA
jgi:maleylacetate reductase